MRPRTITPERQGACETHGAGLAARQAGQPIPVTRVTLKTPFCVRRHKRTQTPQGVKCNDAENASMLKEIESKSTEVDIPKEMTSQCKREKQRTRRKERRESDVQYEVMREDEKEEQETTKQENKERDEETHMPQDLEKQKKTEEEKTTLNINQGNETRSSLLRKTRAKIKRVSKEYEATESVTESEEESKASLISKESTKDEERSANRTSLETMKDEEQSKRSISSKMTKDREHSKDSIVSQIAKNNERLKGSITSQMTENEERSQESIICESVRKNEEVLIESDNNKGTRYGSEKRDDKTKRGSIIPKKNRVDPTKLPYKMQQPECMIRAPIGTNAEICSNVWPIRCVNIRSDQKNERQERNICDPCPPSPLTCPTNQYSYYQNIYEGHHHHPSPCQYANVLVPQTSRRTWYPVQSAGACANCCSAILYPQAQHQAMNICNRCGQNQHDSDYGTNM